MQGDDFFKLSDRDHYKLYEHDGLAIIYYKVKPEPESQAFIEVSNASRINPEKGENLLKRVIRKSDYFLSTENLIEKARQSLDKIVNILGHNNILEQAHALIAVVAPIWVALRIQDERFIASQERSTRYVEFNELYIPEGIKENEEALSTFIGAAGKLLNIYKSALDEIAERLKEQYRKENKNEPNSEYIKTVIEPTARDLVRGLLPIGMETVVFLSSNAKTLENITKKLLAENDRTCNIMGKGLKQVISENLPSISRHLDPDPFEAVYFNNTRKVNQTFKEPIIKSFDDEGVEIYGISENMLIEEIAHIANISMDNVLNYIEHLTSERQGKYDALNNTAFGVGSILFDFDVSIGSLRDLQRHRDTIKNYVIDDSVIYLPKEIIASKMFASIKQTLSEVADARRKLSEMGFADEAKLLMPLATGAKMRMHMGLGEAIYIIENRSTKEAHPEYRRIALEILNRLSEKYPNIIKAAKIFVNTSEQAYSRIEKENADKVNKQLLF